MPLTLSPTCEHDISEQNSACQADGLCPLCLAATLEAKDAEIAKLRAVANAARLLPRTTPKGGGAYTMHVYQIEAAEVWALDRALKALDANEQGQEVAITREADEAATAEIASVKEDARASSALAAVNFARAKKAEAEIATLTARLAGAENDAIIVRELRAALETCASWIDRWTTHVGRCEGTSKCTCGRTAVMAEAAAELCANEQNVKPGKE